MLNITPRKPSKYVVQGYVIVDAGNYHLVQVDGKLGEKPTWWASYPHVTRDYTENQGFFVAQKATSTAQSLLLGETQVNIGYTYTRINGKVV